MFKQKQFLVTDKSGRSMESYKLSKKHIKTYWDNEESLSDFIENSKIGDQWNTQDIKIISI